MGSSWFTTTFLNFLKFLQIKERGPNFLVGTNSPELLNYLVHPSAFQFWKFQVLRFFVIHCTSRGSNRVTRTFPNLLKFPQIKKRGPNFLGGTNSAQWLNYLVPPSPFQFQRFQELKFFLIHCTLMGSNRFTSTFLNFLKFSQIKEGGPNFLVGTNSAERLNYLVPPSVFQFQKFERLTFFVIH